MTAVPGATREVFQVGAELFGEPGIDGDREVVTLMISSLAAAGLTGLHLDLGHVGVYRALAHGAGIANEEGDLFVAIAAKDVPAVSELCRKLPAAWRNALTALPSLYGPAQEVLLRARDVLPDTPAIANALGALGALAQSAGSRHMPLLREGIACNRNGGKYCAETSSAAVRHKEDSSASSSATATSRGLSITG